MMKLLILGLMAALTCAAPPPGMPPMMMPNMIMGGSPMSMLSQGIPPEAMEMIKNLKPEDIKNAIENMPPQMKEMMKGMGISEEQLDEAVKNLPEDLTPMVEQVSKSLESGDISKVMENIEIPEDVKANLKDTALKALTTQMKDMGIEIKDDDDTDAILEKAKTALVEKLKEDGIDINDPESMKAKLMAEMRKMTDASPDETDEEVKMKIAKQILADMKDEGFDVDPENPEESVNKIKEELKKSLKEMDIDFGEDLDINNIGNVLTKALISGKLGNPIHLMMSAMTTFTSGVMPNQMMMQPQPMQQGPMRPPMGMRPYVQGAEDALIHVFGGDDEVIQHLQEVREGAMRGAISEQSIFNIMKDLLHYRLEARVLLAENRMLEERLAVSQVHAMPPFARSPLALRVLGCRHMH